MTNEELMVYLDEIEKEIDRDLYDPDMTLAIEAQYEKWREVSKVIHANHPSKRIEPVEDIKWGKTIKAKLDQPRRFYYTWDFGSGLF